VFWLVLKRHCGWNRGGAAEAGDIEALEAAAGAEKWKRHDRLRLLGQAAFLTVWGK
jgi:hypothetical protein